MTKEQLPLQLPQIITVQNGLNHGPVHLLKLGKIEIPIAHDVVKVTEWEWLATGGRGFQTRDPVLDLT